jgi:hypothetical protein
VVVLTLRLGIHVVAADTLGLPFVRPYLSGRSAEDFACGANFAVGGATALSPDFFRARGFDTMGNKVDLDMEMKWFRGLLDLLCPGNLAGMYVLLHLLVSSSSMLPPHLTGSHARASLAASSAQGSRIGPPDLIGGKACFHGNEAADNEYKHVDCSSFLPSPARQGERWQGIQTNCTVTLVGGERTGKLE